jgi:hypothetical protein
MGGFCPPFLFRYICDRSGGHDVLHLAREIRDGLGREVQRLLYHRRRRMRGLSSLVG